MCSNILIFQLDILDKGFGVLGFWDFGILGFWDFGILG